MPHERSCGEEHQYYPGKYDGYGMPRGPLGTEETGPTAAIGYCAWCGENARGTTDVRGVYDCPNCVHAWYDQRVCEQPRSLEDFVVDDAPGSDAIPPLDADSLRSDTPVTLVLLGDLGDWDSYVLIQEGDDAFQWTDMAAEYAKAICVPMSDVPSILEDHDLNWDDHYADYNVT